MNRRIVDSKVGEGKCLKACFAKCRSRGIVKP